MQSRFKALADYEYDPAGRSDGKLVDVEILGHVFEQSITDLEEMQRGLAAGAAADPAGPSKRKREGAFYTTEAVTRYDASEHDPRSRGILTNYHYYWSYGQNGVAR